MTFLHPLLVWGTLLGAIPIIIHILFRRRYRVVRWAAMEFLLRAIAQETRRVRLQDLILLALRVLALVIAATLISRPMLSPGAARLAGADRHPPDAVIVLDTSYSMTTVTAATQRLDAAKRQAHEVLSDLPPQSRIGVVYMDERAMKATARLTEDRVLAARAIDAAQASSLPGRAEPAFSAAFELLADSKAPQKRIYLFTDGQAKLFERETPALKALIARADPSIRFIVACVANGRTSNLAVTDLQVRNRWLRVGSPVEIEAQVRDVGEPAAAQAGMELWIDSRKVARQTVALTDRRAMVRFSHTFTAAGLFPVEVRLDADAVDIDNHRYACVFIPDRMGIAVIGPESKSPVSAHTFIEAALGAVDEANPIAGTPPFHVLGPMTAQRLTDPVDREIWAVLLTDCGSLSADAVRQLQAFAGAGGSLLISSGPEISATFGSFRSSEGGAGGWLRSIRFKPPDASAPQAAHAVQFALPAKAMSEVAGLPLMDIDSPGVRQALSNVHVFQSVEVVPESDRDWATLLRFTDGRTALLSRPISEAGGHLLLLTTSLDPRWTDLPYRSAMVPLLQDVLTAAVRHRLLSRRLLPLQSWSPVPSENAASLVKSAAGRRILLPGGDTRELRDFAQVDGQTGRTVVRFDQTTRPGIYQLAAASTESRSALDAVAVNIDSAESDQTVWTAAQIESLFPPGRVTVLPAGLPPGALRSAGQTGNEIWAQLAAILGAIVLLEAWLAYRFSGSGSPAPVPGGAA